SYFVNHQDISISSTAIHLTQVKYEISQHWEEKHGISTTTEESTLRNAVIGALLSLKLKILDQELDKIQETIKNAESDEDRILYQTQYIKLKNVSKEINTELTRRITR
ncbi:MAG: hypothetical protein K8R53_13645, partial [Bacteroidales bacterium]|nr:hypothetical protein [Bacteroidales bacterium]